jgi:protein TonB
MKRCPHCGVQDHDEAILCKSCMRNFSAPPERKAVPERKRQGSPLRLLLSLLFFGAVGYVVTNPDHALELIAQLKDQLLEAPADQVADADAAAPADAPPETPPPAPALPPAAPLAPPPTEPSSEPPVREAAPRPAPRRPDPRPVEQPRVDDRRPAEPRLESPRPERPAVAETAVTTPAPPPPAQPLRVGGNIKQPTKVRDVRPAYPATAQSSKVQGIVIIEATIGPDGRVRDARILRSVPLLDEAALEAVRQWEYEPTLMNGKPTAVIMTVTVNFRLQ